MYCEHLNCGRRFEPTDFIGEEDKVILTDENGHQFTIKKPFLITVGRGSYFINWEGNKNEHINKNLALELKKLESV